MTDQPTIGVYRMAHLLAVLDVADDATVEEALAALTPLVAAALALTRRQH